MKDVEVTYTPAVVKFEKYDDFVKSVDEVVSMYANASELDIKDMKSVRADINKLKEKLENRRKEIKAQIEQPYNDFKKLYDEQFKKLESVEAELKQAVDDYNDNQKQLRMSTVKAWFDAKADEGDLGKKLFEPYYQEFLKAGDFKKDSFELKKTTIQKMEEVVFKVLDEQTQRDDDLIAITDLCASNNIGPAPYVRNYDSGAPLSEVIAAINADVKLQKEQHEQLKASLSGEVAGSKPVEEVHSVDTETGEIAAQWQAEFKITFPDTETAKLFGGEGGLYEKYGVTVDRLNDWKKI